jgi:dienelactone hydrolase
MRAPRPSGLLSLALIFFVAILAVACATRPVRADTSMDDRGVPDDQPGQYGIGHATVVLTDTSRNPDGSTPATTPGRPLYVHLWYPTTAQATRFIRYTWNNPVYNENPDNAVYPGLPDTPPLAFLGSRSAHLIAEGASLAPGEFPLLVATHGLEGSATKNMPDTLEALASHGYIVASVEHTGDDDAWYQTHFLETYVGLKLGPNPSIYADTIFQRARDVSFVISAVLAGQANRPGVSLGAQADAKRIGVLGYSLGGQTTLAVVAGISAQGLPADRRVRAAFMGAGSNYGLLLNATDYANVRVPLMFFGNDSGIAYNAFNAFANSPHKYRVDIAGWNHHVGGYQTSWCQDAHHSLTAVHPKLYPGAFADPGNFNRSVLADYVFDATFYWSYTGPYELGLYNFCKGSVFDGVSNGQLIASLFGNTEILKARDALQPFMPLEPELPISETARLTSDYAVAFFEAMLRPSAQGMPVPHDPLVRVVRDCENVPAHPFDLASGDRISFVPAGDSYNVTVRAGATLLDKGTTALTVSGNATATVSYPGFSFPVPGTPDPVKTLFVSEDGAITTRTTGDYTGVDDNGSPWYIRGQLLLTNRLTIGVLMKDLDVTAAASGGGVFATYDTTNRCVIITYDGVPAAGTTEPNTLQVVINHNGKIEITIGELANTGPNYAPNILGTIGIASGQTTAANLRKVTPVDFATLRGQAQVTLPFAHGGAIYQQFDQGVAGSCVAEED